MNVTYPNLLRRAVFPALDLLNGTRVGQTLSWLERSQWRSRGELVALQRRKLADTLAWTERTSPSYRDLWQSAPPQRCASSAYRELAGRPVVLKDDLRAWLRQFPVPEYRGRVFTVQTSGSTGEPMTFFRSAEQESWFWALRLRMWQWGGYVLGEPYLTLNLNSRTALRKRVQDLLLRCSYHGFNANRHDVDAVIADLRRKKVRHLVGYASSLYLLSRAMRERRIENPGVVSLLSTGDTLFPSYRRLVEEVFGVGVVDYYGAGGEGFHLASQCEERSGYHIHVENAVVEILRDGRPAAPGELGEIVVTQLDNRAMPLVRYATQDVAVAAGDVSCGCGRALPLLEAVQGRVPDIVMAPDGSALVVHFFTILFEHLEGIRQFQVCQRVDDRITIRVVREPRYDRSRMEAKIRDAVSGATRGSLAVDFEYVPEIPLSRSGKRRFVVSEIMRAPFAMSSRAGDDAVSAVPAA